MNRRTLFAALLAGILAPFVKAAPAKQGMYLRWGRALKRIPGRQVRVIKCSPLVITPEMEARLMKHMEDARNRLRYRLSAEGRVDFWTPNQ